MNMSVRAGKTGHSTQKGLLRMDNVRGTKDATLRLSSNRLAILRR